MFNKEIQKVIKIEGMTCGGCVKRVENVLINIKGVKKVDVSLEDKEARIVLTKDIDSDILKEKIETLGFKVEAIN